MPELGFNRLLAGHHAKLTAVWRIRPVFIDRREGARRSEVIAQWQFSF